MAATTRGIRYPVLSDTANVPRDLGYAAADMEAWLARPRFYSADVPQVSYAAGGTLCTIVIPSQPLASRVFIDFAGIGGFQATGTAWGAGIATTAGTLTVLSGQVQGVTAQWTAHVARARLELPAATAATLTFTNSSSVATWLFGQCRADIRYAGEYA